MKTAKGTIFLRFMIASFIVLFLLAAVGEKPAQAGSQVKIVGPVGSEFFGQSVTALSNGNIVVTDLFYDDGIVQDVGAVYLYNGATRALISTLKGSTTNDRVGYDVIALPNGNFLVTTPYWSNNGKSNAGAVTWVNGNTGLNGVVSAANSLVGPSADDYIGDKVFILSNGNYVTQSYRWDNGGVVNAGAVTWGDGDTGVVGVVSAANSLVGSTTDDRIGFNGVVPLSNGNYVVISSNWNNGGIADGGAVTWGNGTTGIAGVVSVANSLYGSTSNDKVGQGGVAALTNGNYVVQSPNWFNTSLMRTNAGAVTWVNGTTGITGAVTTSNSLTGDHTDAEVGTYVTALSNGNYVAGSIYWDNGAVLDAGAATWGNGSTGTTGTVSAANSLVGSSTNDKVGRPIALANGNYVVSSTSWDDGAKQDVGASTWGNGSTGVTGVISTANSLIGSTAGDGTGSATALSNGNYVVMSFLWDNGATTDVGAVTFANGATGSTGQVTLANSLVGTSANDNVGSVIALTNGNFVVKSPMWNNGAVEDVGAVTWGNGTTGITGAVSAGNSLIGSTAFDTISYYATYALPDGNYLVTSETWDNGSLVDAGAITWGNGSTGTVGTISASNSLVGSSANDHIGQYKTGSQKLIKILPNGNFIAISPEWKKTSWSLQGAVTYGTSATTGFITSANSVLKVDGINANLTADYDAVNDQMVVGIPEFNTVVFFRTTGTFADVPSGYWAESYIERLYYAGITGGCSATPLNYCPTSPVTRAQMAVFLEKGLHGAGFTPANVAATFTDTAGHWAEDWIEALKSDGVTSGCGVGIYCPENSVTRDQMAVFLLKAKYGTAYTPPAVGSDTGFTDVPSDHWAAAWIKQLAAETITGGCGGGLYCPSNAVTRDQMAVFLVKTFDLP